MSNILKTLAAGSASEPTDEYFNQTTLLLHGDGTNGAQNNTFLDSSTNNFTITRNGNTTQGTLSPFSEGWSNYFDGSGDYLTTAASANFGVGTGTFSFECWIYPTANPANGVGTIFDARSSATPQGWVVRVFSDLRIGLYDGPNNLYVYSTGTVTLNQWQHIAIVRSSTSSGGVAFYIDGVASGTGTIASNLGSSWAAYIGRNYSTGFDFNGYVSNMRVVKNAVVYSSAFTPSSTPLQPFGSGTNALLSCQSNRFVDNSGNSLALTPTGNTSVQPFSPFAPSAAYSTSVNGGSGYFDKSGDYLKPPNNALLTLGTNDCALEAWIYLTVNNTDNQYIAGEVTSGGSASGGFIWRVISGNVQFLGPDVATSLTGAVSVGAWTHCLVTRASNRWRLFVNGVLRGTYSDATSVTQTSLLAIGRGGDLNDGYFGGYISQFKIVNGSIPTDYQTASTTVGTSIFTPPTSPATTSSQGTTAADTELLLNFTNAGIFDNTGKNNLETVGNAQIDTSVKKYGTGSIYLDGSDNIVVPNSENFQVRNGNFTIELWYYPQSLSVINSHILDFGDGLTAGQNSWNLGFFGIGNPNKLGFLWTYDGSSENKIQDSSALSTGQWYHIAVVKNGTSLVLYKNGTSVASATLSGGFATSNRPLIMGSNSSLSSGYANGYIDDLRITKGVARYTTTFTPPDAPFPDQ